VRALVAKKGDTIGYAIAWDGRRADWTAWMDAAEQEGIPWAFLVDREGRVAYIGYPGFLDETLDQVVAGTHDLAAAARERQADLEQFRHKKEIHALVKAAEELLAGGRRDEGLRALNVLLDGKVHDDPNGCLTVAWSLMNLDPALKPDYDLARRAAERATALQSKPDPYALDTLAHAWFLVGDARKAAAFEQQAIDAAPAESKEYFRATLDGYQRAADAGG
jgi:tetratricopeptide (TPR) repeat protein